MDKNEKRLYDATKARQSNAYKGYPKSDKELLDEAADAMDDVPTSRAKEIMKQAEADAMDDTWE
jgi:hypothetical protein